MTEELENQELLENPDETQDSNLETEVVDESENSELLKAKEIAENQRIRAEKAERELKALKKPVQTENVTPKNDLSLKDIRALQDVSDEDVDEVMDFAKFKGISIAEAKKSPVMQNLLKVRAEERASAEASATKQPRRSVKEVTHEQVLQDFHSGKVPESDAEIQRLVEAEIAMKRARSGIK